MGDPDRGPARRLRRVRLQQATPLDPHRQTAVDEVLAVPAWAWEAGGRLEVRVALGRRVRQPSYNPQMIIAWGILAAVFVGIYVLVHRARVRTMRRYIERGGFDGADRDDTR
jgi:hypothetical protein